jgi:anti-sigma-K factor RskA
VWTVTGDRGEHTAFDQLAAGFAIHALEPADEQRFREHLTRCAACADSLMQYQAALGGVAGLAEPVNPPAHLRDRIRAAAAAEPRQPTATAAVSSVTQLASRRGRPRGWWIAAAAAAVVAAVVGVVVSATTSGTRTESPLAACAATAGCHRIVLTDSATHRAAAVVVVRGDVAYLQADGLPADNPTASIYVLWQITGQHTPLPVASFDVRAGVNHPIRVGTLAAPYADTSAFAVSLEPGRTIPAAPSHPVAVGSATT